MNQIKTTNSQRLWSEAKKLIPGGTQLLSKRAEMFLPGRWPAYFKKAKGVEITDLDGNKLIDMAYMGVGSSILGYADPDINKAVKKVIDEGSMTTLNSPEEVSLAKVLLNLHPWAGMVRYARTGGEAVAIAVRIARAYSGRDQVAFCGYHGWHDWYLSVNLGDNNRLAGHLLPGLDPAGVPQGLNNTTFPFYYNKIDQLEKIVAENKIGVIVMEPSRHQEPKENFLEKVRQIADEAKAILIFDEVSSGFRNNLGGVHLLYGVTPDIAVFGKAISNGYPMSAVIGKKDIMQAAQKTFISSTYWTERIGPAAALATIAKMKKKNITRHIKMIGGMIARGWDKLAREHGIKIKISGPESLINFSFDYPNAQEIKTLFTQEMLRRGFLATTIVYVSYSHKPETIDKYFSAVDEVFKIIGQGIKENRIKNLLEGPVAHSGFQRLT